jgi:hypothetical protein
MGTRTGMIVLGTIVPIRHLTCYHLLQRNGRGRFGRRFNERDKEDPAAQGRRSGLRPNRGVTFLPSNVGTMQKPPLDPDVADAAPDDPVLTTYDEQHLVTYWRLLDAEADGAEWREVARIVLHIDPDREPSRARKAFDSHLARAKWMADHGYRDLLRGGAIR